MNIYDILAVLGAIIIASAFIYFVYKSVKIATGEK